MGVERQGNGFETRLCLPTSTQTALVERAMRDNLTDPKERSLPNLEEKNLPYTEERNLSGPEEDKLPVGLRSCIPERQLNSLHFPTQTILKTIVLLILFN